MRVLSRIAGIHVVTAALLTWLLLALGWSEWFNLPGFESTTPTPVVGESREPVAKEGRPRGSEAAKQDPSARVARDPARDANHKDTALVSPPQSPIASEPKVRRSDPLPPAPSVVDKEKPLLPGPMAPAPQGASGRPSTPVAPRAEPPPIVVKPVEPKPAPVAEPPSKPAPKVAEPRPTAPPRVAESAPPAPRVAVDTRPAPPVEVKPAPAPKAAPPVVEQKPPMQRAQPVAAAPQRQKAWAPTMRIAGFGPDALADVLDDRRRTGDDVACVVFERLRFRPSTARPLPSAAQEIDLIRKLLVAAPESRVQLGSRIGTSRMTSPNRRLAVDRARYLRNALATRGVSASRISLDTSTGYHSLVGADLASIGASRGPSMGICVAGSTA